MGISFNNWDQDVLNNIYIEASPTTYSSLKQFEEEQIKNRINQRFSVMNRMVRQMIFGNIRSIIISGAPGIGKTFDVERALKNTPNIHSDIIKGTVSATGLYTTLFDAKDGGIVVFDDCDAVFNDEEALNILKSALDSSSIRTISWRKDSSWLTKGVKNIPKTFDFSGGVIFITNIDFYEKIKQQTKLSPHYEALISRSLYLDLTLKTITDRYIRVKDIFINKMAASEGLSNLQAEEIMEFVSENKERLVELSLRTVKHISQLYKFGHDWKDVVRVTKFKN